jgi:hypothetical protein
MAVAPFLPWYDGGMDMGDFQERLGALLFSVPVFALATLYWIGSMIHRRRFSLLELFGLVAWIAVWCAFFSRLFRQS